MFFKQAMPHDAHRVVPLIYEAYASFAHFIADSPDKSLTLKALTHYFSSNEDVMINYRHFQLLVEENDRLVGCVSTLKGSEVPLVNHTLANMLLKLKPEVTQVVVQKIRATCEVEPNEFYLDILAVSPNYRSKGYSSFLLNQAKQLGIESGLPYLALLAVDDLVPFYQKMGLKFYQKRQISNKVYNVMHLNLATANSNPL